MTDSYKFTSLVCELKKEDLVLEAQINFPYENFPNMPAERKRARSTLLFIDLNKIWRKKKNKVRLVQQIHTTYILPNGQFT